MVGRAHSKTRHHLDKGAVDQAQPGVAVMFQKEIKEALVVERLLTTDNNF